MRAAVSDDADALGVIHAASMEEGARAGVGDADLVLGVEAGVIAESWRRAIDAPPSARHRVLTAGVGQRICGFAALAPAADLGDVVAGTPLAERGADLDVIALEVDPRWRQAGHGERLINAVGREALVLGCTRVSAWAIAGDDWLTHLLSSSGFAPAGIARSLARGKTTLTQHLWYTDVSDH